MRKYEIMFIVRPDLEETSIKEVANKMNEMLTSKSTNVLEVKEMGQRDLAYEINKYHKGYYFLFVCEAANDEGIKEFDRLALISEDIIRHLIVRVEK